MRRGTRQLALVLLMMVLAAACGGAAETDDAAGAASEPAADAPTEAASPAGGTEAASACVVADLPLVEPGTLTVATGENVFEPWMVDDDPENGEGYESALVYALAEELGFAEDDVAWVRTGFDQAIAPGSKDYDFNIQQYSITPERDEVVDFSDGYYEVEQALVAAADAAIADATTVAELQSARLGAAIGTTSLDYAEQVIQPEQQVQVFNDNAAAKLALESNQVDAIISDLPTALYITAVEIEGTTVYGQIEGSGTDQFGLLLAKDSPLTECVNLALAALTDRGELEEITTTWMSEYLDAPIISAS